MAKIVSSDAAPAENVHYVLSTVEFDLGGKTKSFSTDDPIAISDAEAHPWLSVEVPQADIVAGSYVEQLAPADDPQSFVNYNGNDPKVAQAAEDAKAEAAGTPVAINAGETQTEVVMTDEVAETLAADPTSKTSDKVKDN